MAKKHLTDLQCQETIYLTPELVLSAVRDYFGGSIPLDPATLSSNPTAARAFAIDPALATEPSPTGDSVRLVDGLKIRWTDYKGIFVNPPYGNVIKYWCQKIHEEAVMGAEIIALLPCGPRFSTKYFQQHILTECLDAICFVSPRVKFLRPDGSGTEGANPYDSMLLGVNADTGKFAASFRRLGRIVRTEIL